MTRATWQAIAKDRSFTIVMFRRGSLWLSFSLLLNVMLILFSFYYWSQRGQPDFFATDGIRLPIPLKARSEPNMSSTYLLPPDPVETEDENTKRVLTL
jgi:intracellular multiplication protein IcmM